MMKELRPLYHHRGIIMKRTEKNELKNAMKNVLNTEDEEWIDELISILIEKMDDRMRIDDDDVDTDLREVLYFLEKNNILKMDMTEKHIVDGRVWKNHYWKINHFRIGEMVDEEQADSSLVDQKFNPLRRVYSSVPEKVWSRS